MYRYFITFLPGTCRFFNSLLKSVVHNLIIWLFRFLCQIVISIPPLRDFKTKTPAIRTTAKPRNITSVLYSCSMIRSFARYEKLNPVSLVATAIEFPLLTYVKLADKPAINFFFPLLKLVYLSRRWFRVATFPRLVITHIPHKRNFDNVSNIYQSLAILQLVDFFQTDGCMDSLSVYHIFKLHSRPWKW